MNSFSVTFGIEILKVRKSKVFPWTLIFFTFVASMMGLMMFVNKYPDISAKLGMIGNKASMMRLGEPNWENYMDLLIQGIAGVGLVGIGFITSWIYGREFSDHTLKDIFVVPVSREIFVISKLIVVVLWSLLLALIYLAAGIIAGLLIRLDGFSPDAMLHYIYTYTITSLLMLLLSTPVAYLASYSNGYILPLGFVVLTLILANFTGLVGLGPYFPWSVPGLFGMSGETEEMQLNITSYIILFLTGLAGLYGTIAYWKFADHK